MPCMERVFVVGSRKLNLYDKWCGSMQGYADFEANLDEKRDRVLSKLNLKAIKTKQDYYEQLVSIQYPDKRQQNAFQNWAIFNYGNQRERFFKKWILPHITDEVKHQEVQLPSGKIVKGMRLDERSYVIPIHRRTRSGRIVEYLQRRDFRTGRILSSKGIFH